MRKKTCFVMLMAILQVHSKLDKDWQSKDINENIWTSKANGSVTETDDGPITTRTSKLIGLDFNTTGGWYPWNETHVLKMEDGVHFVIVPLSVKTASSKKQKVGDIRQQDKLRTRLYEDEASTIQEDFHGMNYLGHFKQLLSNMDSYNWEGITQQPDQMVSLRSNFDLSNSGHKQIVHVYRGRKGGSYNTNKRSEATNRKRGHSVAVSTTRKGPQQSDVKAPSNILLHSIINKDINNKSSEQLLEKAEISPNRRLLGKTEIYPADSTTQHKSNLELYLQQIDMMDDKDKTMDSTTLKDEETNMNLTKISHHEQSYSSQASSQKHKSSFDFRQTYSTTQDSALDIAKLNVHNVYKPSFFSQIQTRNNEHKELHTQHSGGLQTREESLEDPEVQIYNSQVYVNQYIYPFPESSQSNTSFYEPPIRFRTKTHISVNNMSHPNEKLSFLR